MSKSDLRRLACEEVKDKVAQLAGPDPWSKKKETPPEGGAVGAEAAIRLCDDAP